MQLKPPGILTDTQRPREQKVEIHLGQGIASQCRRSCTENATRKVLRTVVGQVYRRASHACCATPAALGGNPFTAQLGLSPIEIKPWVPPRVPKHHLFPRTGIL
jgi:hypothetical protein